MAKTFKTGDIVVVINNNRIFNPVVKSLAPIGMVTEIIKNQSYLSEKWYYFLLSGLKCITLDIEKFRMATPREQFLYHLEGKPFIMEKE